ncbi:MAG TPA: hypothetical protein VMU05_07995 [Dongiaceae bacterium]|nr:hypothetical protein [Dongiaceae bacterium]
MQNIISLVGIPSPIANFDGDDKGISYDLLRTINILREGSRIVTAFFHSTCASLVVWCARAKAFDRRGR